MPNVVYEQLIANEDITDGQVLKLSGGDNNVAPVSGDNEAIIGVADETVSEEGLVRVVMFGRKTVTCFGTVTVGDMVKGAATGKVQRHVGVGSYATQGHTHAIDAGAIVASSTQTATTTAIIQQGRYSGSRIIGKALTGGTNTTIDIFVGLIA